MYTNFFFYTKYTFVGLIIADLNRLNTA